MKNLPEVLGDWGTREGPLYRRLATAIAEAVEGGTVGQGTVLPAERALALRLAIGRSTVVAAYELLRQQGVVESRQGSGTWVAGAPPHPSPSTADALATAALRSPGHVIDLATAGLPAHPAVRDVIAHLGDTELPVLDTPGYSPAGLPALRDAVADYLTNLGLPTQPAEVLITTGDQQALWLLVRFLLQAGEAVLEDPTSPGILDVLRAQAATIRSAPPLTDPRGPADLAAAGNRADARLLYVMATINPHGAIATEDDRRQLLRGLRRECVVIDDLSSIDLTFDPAPLPLAAIAPDRVISVGSMSKLFWGGLRVGYIRAGRTVIDRLSVIKSRIDLGTPLLSQIVCAQLLTGIEQARDHRVAELRDQHDYALDTLRGAIPELHIAPAQGGLNIWARLPTGTGSGLADVASRFGVAIVAGSVLSHRGAADDGIRIVYARPSDVFDAGVSRLAAAWRAYRAFTEDGLQSGTGPILV
jgi:DNA-binding transcriptional MocR family regulator